jgi:hypothetical protein
MFFTFENFKSAFLGDMRQWWSRHWHRRRPYRRRHRCSRSSVKRKRNDAKGKKLVKVSKDEHDVRREELPFVCSFTSSFVSSFVRLSSWKKENDNVEAKSNDEGKKEQNNNAGKKNNLIANRGLKSRVHRHTWLEECVGRGGFIFISCGQKVKKGASFYLHTRYKKTDCK